MLDARHALLAQLADNAVDVDRREAQRVRQFMLRQRTVIACRRAFAWLRRAGDRFGSDDAILGRA